MKTAILLLFLLSLAVSSHSNDKELHMYASAFAAMPAVAIVDIWMPEKKGLEKWLWCTGLAMIPGVAKELYDSRKGGSGWDNMDLLADLAGASGGSAMILTITWTW